MANAALPSWVHLNCKARRTGPLVDCASPTSLVVPDDEPQQQRPRHHRTQALSNEHRTLSNLCHQRAWREIIAHCQRIPQDACPRYLGQAHTGDNIIKTRTVFHPTPLGIICSLKQLAHVVPQEILLQTVRALVSASPQQVRCSQCQPGRTPLYDSFCNVSCPPAVVELLLQVDAQRFGKALSSFGCESDRAVDQVDREGVSLCEHVIQHLQFGSSPFALQKLQLLLQYSSHRQVSSNSSHRLLIKLLSQESSSWCASQPHGMDKVGHRHGRLDDLTKAVALLLAAQPTDMPLLSISTKMSDCTPLHVALRNYGYHSPLILTLLHFYKNRGDDGYAVFRARNASGDLPLHVACRAGVSLDVLKIILDMTLESSTTGMVDGATSTCHDHPLVFSVNKEGCTPVELIWVHHVESTQRPVFSCMMERRRQAASPPSRNRHALYKSLLDKMVNQVIHDFQGSGDSSDDRQHYVQHILGDLLRRTFLLIRAAAGKHGLQPFSGTHDFILHSAASLSGPKASTLPLPLLNLILWLCPQQVFLKDRFGKLPLHYAVDGSRDALPTPKWEKCSADDWVEWVEQLCSRHVRSCSAVDAVGRTPLHYALDYAPRGGRDDKVDQARDAVARKLVDICPQSVVRRDPHSGLLPFMLAACNQRLSLSTVYEILRQSPSVMCSY